MTLCIKNGIPDWPRDMVKELAAPPSVSVATQDGHTELPQFLLLLAGALHGPAGEALAMESPVVIAPNVSNATIANLTSLLSSGRSLANVSLADEAALMVFTSNLGLDCNFTRKRNVRAEQILSRGFGAVEDRGDVFNGAETEEVEVGEVEDISSERFAKMHKKGEMWEKKVDKKQQQSARWQLRKERETGKKKINQLRQQKPADTPRIWLGPEPEAATHIYIEKDENAPVTIFGRVLPTITDATPFELPWLGKSASSKRKSSVESKKQLKMGGKLKNKVREEMGNNVNGQETGTIEDNVGGAIDQKNNDEVNIEGDFFDRENNTDQRNKIGGKCSSKMQLKFDDKENSGSSSKRRVEPATGGKMEERTEIRRVGVKISSKQSALSRLLNRCKCCAFTGSDSALLRHLLIHYSDQIGIKYKKAIEGNRCPMCGFSSSAIDNYHVKQSMLRHIGVLHKKVLDLMKS